MISSMHVLDDDLRNDTFQSNLADERYMINCKIISKKLEDLDKAYTRNNVREINNYENSGEGCEDTYLQLESRFKDSIYINSEY